MRFYEYILVIGVFQIVYGGFYLLLKEPIEPMIVFLLGFMWVIIGYLLSFLNIPSEVRNLKGNGTGDKNVTR